MAVRSRGGVPCSLATSSKCSVINCSSITHQPESACRRGRAGRRLQKLPTLNWDDSSDLKLNGGGGCAVIHSSACVNPSLPGHLSPHRAPSVVISTGSTRGYGGALKLTSGWSS